ncbi:hypothetical protein JCM5350_004899 [Sporobolomyces pararoseus]
MRRKSATPTEDEERRAPKRMKLSPKEGGNQGRTKTSSPPLLGVTEEYSFEGRQMKPDVVLSSIGNRGGKIYRQKMKEELQQLKSELSKIWKRNKDGFEYESPPSSVAPSSVVGDLIEQLQESIQDFRQPYDPKGYQTSGGGLVLFSVIRTLYNKASRDRKKNGSMEGYKTLKAIETLFRTIGREAKGDCSANAARPSEVDEVNELVIEKIVEKFKEVFGDDIDFEARLRSGFQPQTALLSGSCMIMAHWPPVLTNLRSKFLTGAYNFSSELLNRKFDVRGPFPFFDIVNFALPRKDDGSPDLIAAFTPNGNPAHHAGPYFASEALKATNKVLLKTRFIEDGVTVVCGGEPVKLLKQLLSELGRESGVKVSRHQRVLEILNLKVEIDFNIVVTENGTHLIFETCHPSFGSSARTQPDTPEHQAKRLALDLVLDFVYLLDYNKLNDPARAGIFWER